MIISNKSSIEIYLKNILLRIPGSIYWKDLDGKYLGCNQMQAELGGLKSPEDVIGKRIINFHGKALLILYMKLIDVLCAIKFQKN